MPTGKNKVSIGESGLLSLRFINGKVNDSIRVHCQVTNMSANGMGLSIRFYELNKKERLSKQALTHSKSLVPKQQKPAVLLQQVR